MRIITNQNRIPWSWALVILFPWLATMIREQVSVVGMTFTLRKFIDNPAIIGLVLSSNYAFGLTVGSFIAFISDYIWTPLGRRRPFLLISFFCSGVLSFFIPMLDTAWIVIALILLFQLMADFAGPYEPITMEVIPSPQRGRSQVMTIWYKLLGGSIAMTLLIGNFDHIYPLFGRFTITGEQVMYWVMGTLLIAAAAVLFFFVREEKPKDFKRVPISSLLTRTLFRELTHPRILRLMGLFFVMQNLWMGMFQYEALLITEQWGYEKSVYGKLFTISMFIAVPLVPIAGWLSDRVDRMILLKIGMLFMVSANIVFYVCIHYFIAGTPPVYAVFIIGFMKSTVGAFLAVACIPLIFDFVPRNRLGTLGCAMGLVASFITFISTNIMGVWITFSSKYVYRLPEGKYDYMAAYHCVILLGVAGIVYLYYFSRAEKKGLITRIGLQDTTENISIERP